MPSAYEEIGLDDRTSKGKGCLRSSVIVFPAQLVNYDDLQNKLCHPLSSFCCKILVVPGGVLCTLGLRRSNGSLSLPIIISFVAEELLDLGFPFQPLRKMNT